MPFVFLDALGNVQAISTSDVSLAAAQALNPSITERVDDGPPGLLHVEGAGRWGNPNYYHRRTSGDGTDISHYSQINVVGAVDVEPLRPVQLTNVSTTSDQLIRVATEAPEGKRLTRISPNFCDQTTWYYDSTKVTGMPLADSGDQLTYNGTGAPWVDNYHGKYYEEDQLVTKDGDVPRMVVYVNGVVQVEQDPHLGSGGDYTVDYAAGTITFLSARQPADIVTADVWTTNSSMWIFRPHDGYKARLIWVEVQYSEDVALRDTIIYQAYAYNPNDLPNKVPVGLPSIYKSMWDFISESNRSYPQIMPTTASSPSWRDVTQKVNVMVWDFRATVDLLSSQGAELRVFLEHDVPHDGALATVAFYAVETSE